MARDRGLTALEVLSVAIKSEIEAASLYALLATQVGNATLVAKFDFLRQEEEKHCRMFEDMYSRRFPDVQLKLPARSLLPAIEASSPECLTVPELFQMAMRAEQASADFYSQEADRSGDEVGRTMLRYLSNVERSHYRLLEIEYDLVSRFPEYYKADEFHFGDELMHVGP